MYLTVMVQSIRSVTVILSCDILTSAFPVSTKTLHLQCVYCTISSLTCYTHTHTQRIKEKDAKRGSDLDVLTDQYIFTSVATDYPLPHYITVISLRLYCNSVQDQAAPSVACLLDVTCSFNAHNTYGYGLMRSNQMQLKVTESDASGDTKRMRRL